MIVRLLFRQSRHIDKGAELVAALVNGKHALIGRYDIVTESNIFEGWNETMIECDIATDETPQNNGEQS